LSSYIEQSYFTQLISFLLIESLWRSRFV